jgi:DNA-binding NarL/FixJ family response regulator
LSEPYLRSTQLNNHGTHLRTELFLTGCVALQKEFPTSSSLEFLDRCAAARQTTNRFQSERAFIMPFRVVCADESPATQRGIAFICNQHRCGVDLFVSSLSELKSALVNEHFDVLICDYRLQNHHMMDEIAEIKKGQRDLKCILYASTTNPTLIAQSVAHGFYDAVLKQGSAMKLVRSLQSLEDGQPLLDSMLVRFRDFMNQVDWPVPPGASSLTRRELHILLQLGLGLCNREIGSALNISLETVKEHLQNIFRKLKVADRTAAAVWALKNQLPTVSILPTDLE